MSEEAILDMYGYVHERSDEFDRNCAHRKVIRQFMDQWVKNGGKEYGPIYDLQDYAFDSIGGKRGCGELHNGVKLTPCDSNIGYGFAAFISGKRDDEEIITVCKYTGEIYGTFIESWETWEHFETGKHGKIYKKLLKLFK